LKQKRKARLLFRVKIIYSKILTTVGFTRCKLHMRDFERLKKAAETLQLRIFIAFVARKEIKKPFEQIFSCG